MATATLSSLSAVRRVVCTPEKSPCSSYLDAGQPAIVASTFMPISHPVSQSNGLPLDFGALFQGKLRTPTASRNCSTAVRYDASDWRYPS
jgi:hypothetical protein